MGQPLNRIGAHRVACLSLYRAILTRCSRVPLTPDQKERLRIFTKKQFKKNRSVSGYWSASAALRIGYEVSWEEEELRLVGAESILRASADGNLAETSRIVKLVNELPSPRKPRSIRAAVAVKTERATPHKHGAPYPGAIPVLSRPHRITSGRRHIPVLVTCSSGISFLRFKKPQSPYLSRILRTKIKWRQKLSDLQHRLQEEMGSAAYEDHWDELLREQHGVICHQTNEPKWTDCYKKSLEECTKKFKKFTWRNMTIAKRMQEIIDQERELAEEEKREKERARTERKKMMLEDPESNTQPAIRGRPGDVRNIY